MENRSQVMDRKTLAREYQVGTKLAARILELLPHFVVGHAGNGPRRMAARADAEKFFNRARAENIDLIAFVRDHNAIEVKSWLEAA
jgi:hypothetical protein